MLRFSVKSCPCTLTLRFGFLLVISLFLLLERLSLGRELLLAMAVHELGHLLILLLQRRPPESVDCSAFGICIRRGAGERGFWGELLLYLAGPGTNMLAALLLQPWNKVAAAFHLVLAAVNLLPLEPLDGGNCLRLFLEQLLPSSALEPALRRCRWGCIALLTLLAGVLFLRQQNPSLLLFALLLALNKG